MDKQLYRPVVFSRHPTHNILRTELPKLPFRSVIRLGSTTELSERRLKRGRFIECNSIQGVINTSNKLYMKRAFDGAEINTPAWFMPCIIGDGDGALKIGSMEQLLRPTPQNFAYDSHITSAQPVPISSIRFPLIAKINFHSRGRGMLKIDTTEQLLEILKQPNVARKYTFEVYTNFVREYRVHATIQGIFYICRKLRKQDHPDRWYFNSKNSIFKIVYENETWLDEELKCFKAMEEQCIRALDHLGMDIAGFDVKVNSTGEKFTFIEANSACSFGEHTAQHYIKKIPEILTLKYQNYKNAI